MATKIVTKNSSTASAVPTASDLVQGELAVNVADKRLFTEDNGGSIVELGTNPSTIDINAGTIDGTAIGASSASTGAFTTLTASGLTVDTNTLYVDSTNNRVGIGTTSPSGAYAQPSLHIHASGNGAELHLTDGTTGATSSDGMSIFQYANDGYIHMRENGSLRTYINGSERMRIDSSGKVGIGTTSPSSILSTSGTDTTAYSSSSVGGQDSLATLKIQNLTTSANSFASIDFNTNNNRVVNRIVSSHGSTTTDGFLAFVTEGSGTPAERMRIDSSGNLLVGTTDTDLGYTDGDSGVVFNPDGYIQAARDSAFSVLYLNKLNNDGTIIQMHKDGSTVGTIGAQSAGTLFIAGSSSQNTGVRFFNTGVAPCNSSGDYVDNSRDLGASSVRWDDVYATNGTIQTSDRNEKQDIAELSEAEQRVAVACKGLLRKFRWKDSVAEKGDDARIHFGIIAQDLQAAFEAEGLDAGDYAIFISTTWWEQDVEVPAVEAVDAVYETQTDEEGNETQVLVQEAVEAVDAYTRTDTFETAEEAPEGATEKTRLGVRYSELLAFIISAI